MTNYRMKPTISVITLGVNDLGKSLGFYRDGLGLETKGIIATEFKGDETHPSGAVVMFELQNGVILALYPRTELAKDAKEALGVASPTEFSLGQLVRSKSEVDSLLAQAKEAGATITDEPHDRPWGIYSGYFKDLDGHLWEVIWNPEMSIEV
jgi:predicted lactoylglutathione lyase